jgi:hypothetical protein
VASIRPHWRKMTWAVLVFNVLMLVWIIAGAASTHNTPNCVHQLGSKLCTDATETGAGIGIAILIVLWVLGDAILGVLWLVTRGRSCPVCGRPVRRGLVACAKCGHDFRVGAQAA